MKAAHFCLILLFSFITLSTSTVFAQDTDSETTLANTFASQEEAKNASLIPTNSDSHDQLKVNPVELTPPQDIYEVPLPDARIWTSIGFTVLYGAAFWGIAVPSIYFSMDIETYSVSGLGTVSLTIGSIMLAGALVAPAFAVHTAHTIWGGDGSLGWTYLGSIIGSVSGAALGSLAFISDTETGLILTPILGLIGGTIGAIVAYERSNVANQRDKYNGISSLYPILEVSATRTTVGFGMTF